MSGRTRGSRPSGEAAAEPGKRRRSADVEAGSANLGPRRGRSADNAQHAKGSDAGEGQRARRTASKAPETSASAEDVASGAAAILALSHSNKARGASATSSNQPSPRGRRGAPRACSPSPGTWASSSPNRTREASGPPDASRSQTSITEVQARLPGFPDTRGAESPQQVRGHFFVGLACASDHHCCCHKHACADKLHQGYVGLRLDVDSFVCAPHIGLGFGCGAVMPMPPNEKLRHNYRLATGHFPYPKRESSRG